MANVIKNPLPPKNAIGRKYQRWHAKHPANAIVVPGKLVPTIAPQK